MTTYLVVFRCLVVSEPYIQYIEASTVDECWLKAYEISRRPELCESDFEIYKKVEE